MGPQGENPEDSLQSPAVVERGRLPSSMPAGSWQSGVAATGSHRGDLQVPPHHWRPRLGPLRAEDTPSVAALSRGAPSIPRPLLRRPSLAAGWPAPAGQPIKQPPGNDCHYVIAVSRGPVICHC